MNKLWFFQVKENYVAIERNANAFYVVTQNNLLEIP